MSGLYIHIPFCERKCAYCDFPSWAGRQTDAARYLAALVQEAALWRQARGPMAFDTVYVGGGTPSLLPAGALEGLFDILQNTFDLTDVTEFTVEANPGTVDAAKLSSLRRTGANRLSFGVQAAQDELLQRIGRIHTWAQFVAAVEMARAAGFANLSGDMMTGLPGQTADDAADTAERLAALGLDHVSCYGLVLEEGTPLARAVEAGRETVPDDDAERDSFHRAKAVLLGHEFERYEISNFAKPGRACRHNLNYWARGDYLGLGCGAASHFSGWRRENAPSLDDYLAAVEEGHLPPGEEHRLNQDEQLFETVMLALRTGAGMSEKRIMSDFALDFYAKWRSVIDKLMIQGLLYRQNGIIALTERGMDLQNTVLMEFMG